MLNLSVEKRDTATKLATLRRGGSVPAVVYGAHQEATPVIVDAKAFEKVLRAAGEATVVTLDGLGAALPVLIHEVSLDPLTSLPQHVDFYAITKGEKVNVAVPLSFVGESPAVKAGANLVKVMHELEVIADPMNLPHAIEVDISVLAEIGDQIHARDLSLPKDVELDIEPEEVVVLAQEVVEEVVETTVADIDSIQVEKKGKEETEAAA